MIERMTDEKHAFMLRLDRLTAHQQRAAMADWSRARRAEEGQAERLACLEQSHATLERQLNALEYTFKREREACHAMVDEKEKTIRALVGALDAHGMACRVTLRHERPECSCVGCSSTRALRLSGRLP